MVSITPESFSYRLLRRRFFLSIGCSIETPVRQIHHFVSLCCNRISRLLARCQPIPHLALSQNQRHVSDCHSLHLIGIFCLPPTRDGFSIFLENEASTRGLCHMITACQGAHAACNAPPAPPLLIATHAEARWLPSNSICGQQRGTNMCSII